MSQAPKPSWFFASVDAQDILSRATGALPPNQAVLEASYSPLKQSIRNRN